MKTKKIEGKMKWFIIFIILLVTYSLIGTVSALPADPGHGASSISAGTFEGGHYIFPNNLSVTQNFTVDTDTLFVDSVLNRIGIGTTSPTQKLHVEGNTNITGSLDVLGSMYINRDTSNYLYIGYDGSNFRFDPYGSGNIIYNYNTGTARSFTVYNGSTTSLLQAVGSSGNIYLAPNKGNVGIGTTSPNYLLDVNGSARVDGRITVANGSANGIVFDDGDTGIFEKIVEDRIYFVAPGGVYFPSIWGSVSGTTTLNIYSSSEDTDFDIINQNGVYNANLHLNDGILKVEGTGNSYFNGNVGIGLTTPDDELTVSGTANATDFVCAGSGCINAVELNSDVAGLGLNSTSGVLAVNIASGGGIVVSNDAVVLNQSCGDGQILKWDNVNSVWNCSDDTDTTGYGDIFVNESGDTMTGNLIINANLTVDTSDLFVDSTAGRVGIGTTSPNYLLDVNGSASINGTTFFVDSATNKVGIGTTTPTDELNVIGVANITGNMSVGNNVLFVDTESFKKRVGIGTNTPAVSKLHVQADVAPAVTIRSNEGLESVMQFCNSGGCGYFGMGKTGSNFYWGGTPAGLGAAWPTMTIGVSGANVAIGLNETTPDARLEIISNADPETLMISSERDADGDLLVVKNTGYIGVGTTNPESLLHLSSDGYYAVYWDSYSDTNWHRADFFFRKADGTASSKTPVTINDNLGGMNWAGWDGSAWRQTSQIFAEVDATPGASDMPSRMIFLTTPDDSATPLTRMTIKNTGNIGIGTESPSEKLNVNGSLRVDNATGSAVLFVNSSNGRVGIGTINPVVELDVIGNLRNSATFYTKTVNAYSDALGGIKFNNNAGSITVLQIDTYNNRVGIMTTTPQGNLNVHESSPSANQILLNISTNGGTRFKVDEDGDVNISGTLDVDGTGTHDIEGTLTVDDITCEAAGCINAVELNSDVAGDGLDSASGVLSADVTDLIASGQGLAEIATNNLGLNQSCDDGEILKWDDSNSVWNCSSAGPGSESDTLDTVADRGATTDKALTIDSDGNEQTSIGGNLTVDSGTLFVDKNTNRVGIGTTNPSEKLNVNGSLRVDNATGSAVLFVNSSSERVGIGTSSPAATLEVNKTVSGDWLAVFDNPASDGDGVLIKAGSTVSDNHALRVQNYVGGEILYVKANGYVGIGIEPSYKLHVMGNAQISSDVLFNSSVMPEFFWDSNPGRVGIGTVNPSSMLHVEDGDVSFNGSNSPGGFFFDEGSGRVGIGTTSPSEKLNVNGSLRVDNATGSAVLFVNSSSEGVGIGTASPEGKLHILNSSTQYLKFDFTSQSGVINYTRSGITGDLYVYVDSNGNSYQWIFGGGASQDAGVFRSPQGFSTSGNLSLTGTNGGWVESWFGPIIFGVGDTEYFRLNGDGKVGIGTSSPSRLLHVEDGDVLFNGSNSPEGFFFDESSGRVGIGTASPVATLHVKNTSFAGKPVILLEGATQVVPAVPRLRLWGGGVHSAIEWDYRDNLQFSTVTDSSGSGETIIMTLWNTDMKKGIKTTVPLGVLQTGPPFDYVFSVNGNASIDGSTFVVDDVNNRVGIGTNSPQTKLDIHGDGTENILNITDGSNDVMYIDSDGKVGIGTSSPSEALSVTGNVSVTENLKFGTGSHFISGQFVNIEATAAYKRIAGTNIIDYFGGNYFLRSGTPGSWNTRFFINGTNGNVGIGEPSPQQTLHVDGTIRFEDLASNADTDYICVDANGDLSSSDAGCTKFKSLTVSSENMGLADDEIVILDVAERRYPEDFPAEDKRGGLYEYYYTVQFNLNGQEVVGTIKVPKTLESDEDILHYLKGKIEKEKGYGFDTTPVSSELKGKKFKILGEREVSWASWTVPEKIEPGVSVDMSNIYQNISHLSDKIQEQQGEIDMLKEMINNMSIYRENGSTVVQIGL